MATATSTGSWLDPPELHGKRNSDGTFTLEELELKKLNDYNRKVSKMIQGGLNLANLNKETNEVLVFKSLRSLAETLGLNRKNVAAVLDNRKNNTYTNFEFSYQCPTTMADDCKPVESSDSKRVATLL